jgi:hypothetical protein
VSWTSNRLTPGEDSGSDSAVATTRGAAITGGSAIGARMLGQQAPGQVQPWCPEGDEWCVE